MATPARLSFETLIPATSTIVIYCQVPTKQAKLVPKTKGTTLLDCKGVPGLIDGEGTSAYDTWVLSIYRDITKDERAWTEMVFCPPSINSLADQATYNFEVTDGIDAEWPRLTQTFFMLRSDYTKGMAVTAPPAQAGTGWVRVGERELKTPDDKMHAFFVVLEVEYTTTAATRIGYEFDPETRNLVTVTRQIVASSSTPSLSVGKDIDQRQLGTGFSLRTTRDIGASAPTAYELVDWFDFEFPALLQSVTPTAVTALDGSTTYRINPLIRAAFRKKAKGRISVDYFDLSSAPTASTLFDIKPNDLSYSGFLFSVGFYNVINNAGTITATTGSDDPTWGPLVDDEFTYSASTPTLTAYNAAIGTEVLIAEKFDRWRYGYGRRSRIYITLE